MTRAPLVLVALTACLAIGCGDDAPPSVTGPTEISVLTEHFTGTLVVGGAKFYSFTVRQSGAAVSVLLASLTSPQTGAPMPATVGLGFGIPAGTGCGLSHSLITGASLVTQLTAELTPGIYCVSVYDTGTLTSDVNFALRFQHP